MSGIEICRALRKTTDAPVIFVSCLGEEYDNLLTFPGLQFDLANTLVFIDNIPVDLPKMEFHLLARLARNPGWTFSAEQLFSLVWGTNTINTRK